MNEELLEKFKELNDLEFEIIFIDSICKKLKSLDRPGIRSATMLFMYLSILDSLRKYKELAEESKRSIGHSEVIDLIISKGDSFLSSVAWEETQSYYVYKSMSDIYEIIKELLSVLKSEMTEDPNYSHLKQT